MLARRSLPIQLLAVALCTTLACSDQPATTPSPVLKVAVVAGTNGQEARPGTSLAQPLTVGVTLDGAPAPGVMVTWSASSGTLGRTSAVTGNDGQATSAWTLGPEVGVQTATASVEGADGSPITFTARALEDTPDPGPAGPVGLVVSPDEPVLEIGEAVSFTAEFQFADGSYGPASDVVWSSSDGATAAVSREGVVTGVRPGHAFVHVSALGLASYGGVTVVGPTVAVTLVPDPPVILVGEEARWQLEARDAAGSLKYGKDGVWSSSDPGVVFVQPNGRILGISPGTATVSAVVEGITGSAELTVLGPLDLSGGWTMAESLAPDTYPPSPACPITGPVRLRQAEGSVAIEGTYDRTGECPLPWDGSLDLTGTVALTGTMAGSVLEMETHTLLDCAYRGVVDRVTWRQISGMVYCSGRPGTPEAGLEFSGGFTLSK